MQSTIATPTEPDLDEDSLTEEEVFKLLSNSRRRYVIHALKNRQAPVGMVELSIQVTAWERDLDPLAVKYEHRRNVYSTLQRTHIPKLEQAGIVTVDEGQHERRDGRYREPLQDRSGEATARAPIDPKRHLGGRIDDGRDNGSERDRRQRWL